MNYRINTKTVVLVLLLVFVVVAIFIHTLISAPTTTEVVPDSSDGATSLVEERVITAKHQYKEGVHTIVGTAEVPTMCHRLVSEPFFTDDTLRAVEIRFNTLLEGDSCTGEVFSVPFKITFDGLQEIVFTATWNGDPARLNLIPVSPDEVLDEEVYIKG